MPTTALAFQVPPEANIKQSQIEVLAEFRQSLRDSYTLQRLPLQGQLVDQMMGVCERIIQQYPEGCKCSQAQGANQGTCKCCARLFKAADVIVELEKLSTKRQAHEANLVIQFVRSFAEMLKDDKPEEPSDPTADRIFDMVTPQADAVIPREVLED